MQNKIIVMYVLLGLIIYRILKEEIHDLWCVKTNNKQLYKGDGYSKHYKYGRNEKSDDAETLLDKIEWLTHFKSRTVLWRRYIIMSIAITFLMIYFTIKKRLSVDEFLISVFIIYLTLFSFSNFYYYHYERYPEMHMRDNITELRNKLNLKKNVKEYSET